MLASSASMKHGLLALTFVLLLPPRAGSAPGAKEVVARAVTDLAGIHAGIAQTPLDQLVGRAMIGATHADVALVPPIPSGARITRGPVRAGDLLALVPADSRLLVAPMTGEQIGALLERTAGRFATYDFADGRAPLEPGQGEAQGDAFAGLSYELDVTAPKGGRVFHLAFQGQPLEPGRSLRVAVTEDRARRGDPELAGASEGARAVMLHDALIAHARGAGTLGRAFERDWSVLPDYAAAPERPLIDALVRTGALPREEALRLFPDEPARRGEFAYWLARAFGWRANRLSGAFPDVPDSLEAWIDGLIRHRVLDAGTGTSEFFQPFALVTLPVALEWCGNAARARGSAAALGDSVAFGTRLLAATSLPPGAKGDTLTRAQALGIVANTRQQVPGKRK